MIKKLTKVCLAAALLPVLDTYAGTEIDIAHDQIADAQEINRPYLWPKPEDPLAAGAASSSPLKVVQNFSGDLYASDFFFNQFFGQEGE